MEPLFCMFECKKGSFQISMQKGGQAFAYFNELNVTVHGGDGEIFGQRGNVGTGWIDRRRERGESSRKNIK